MGMHLLLFLVVVFGAAFFVSHDKSLSLPALRAVPTKLIDDALSGGGGNPNIAPSDAQQKGQTLVSQPVQPTPPPQRETKRAETKPEIKKAEPAKPTKPVKDQVKEAVKPVPDQTAKTAPLALKPWTRTTADKLKEQADVLVQMADATVELMSRLERMDGVRDDLDRIDRLESEGDAMVMGDLVLLDEEVPAVMSALIQNGITVTALHNHLNQVSPHVMYLHYSGMGDPVQLANGLHQALASSSGTPLTGGGSPSSASSSLDTAQIQEILGRTGNLNGDVFQVARQFFSTEPGSQRNGRSVK